MWEPPDIHVVDRENVDVFRDNTRSIRVRVDPFDVGALIGGHKDLIAT